MTGYTDIFGGSAIEPSDVAYNLLTGYVSPLQLQWPSLAREGDSVAARILEIATAGTVRLPDASLVSTGQDFLFRNTSGGSVAIQSFTGASILTLASGEVKYAYLTDTSTSSGIWTVVAFGVGTGTLDASQLVGFGLTVIGATLNMAHPVSDVNTSFTIQSTDRARLYNFTGGAQTLALLTASGYGNNFFFAVSNNGSGAVTIDPAGTDTIDGAVTIDINPGESTFVMTDGANWFTVGRGRSVVFNFTQLVKNVAGGTDVTLTTSEAGNKVLKFIGLLTANINVIVPNVVSLYIVDNETTGAFTLTVKTAAGTGIAVPQNNRNILYSDGTNVLQAVTVSVAATTFGDGSAAAPSITFGSDTDTGFYRPANNTVGITTGGTLRVSIDGTTLSSTVVVSAPDGTVANPGVRWASSSSTGLFSSSDNTVRVSSNGVEVFKFGTTDVSTSKQIVSTLATGTSPFSVASTTNVANLNASSLNGATFSAPGAIGGGTPGSGAFTTISASGVITSTVLTGTSPFSISSTTVVPNLNASMLLGNTWAAPGPIGGAVPGSGAFTTVKVGGGALTGLLNVSVDGSGTNPVQINDTNAGAGNQISINFLRNGVSVGSVSTTDVATFFNTSSDYRLKDVIGPVIGAIEKIKRMRPIEYKFKYAFTDYVFTGFLAHEMAEVIPYAVTGEKDAVSKENYRAPVPVYQSVDYTKIVPELVAALQEALAKIEKLEKAVWGV